PTSLPPFPTRRSSDLLCTRKFGYPGKADPDLEHIWLLCDGCTGAQEVRLNGQALARTPGESFAFDVTRLMAERNVLEISLDGNTDRKSTRLNSSHEWI